MTAAVDEVKRRAGVAAAPHSWLCDFGSQAQIRKLASDVLAKYDRLDVLVNNAGLGTLRREVTEDGIERTFAVNHLGPFLLTNLLLDLLVKSAPARVVNVASVEHYDATMDLSDLGFERGGWGFAKAYRRSKPRLHLPRAASRERSSPRASSCRRSDPGRPRRRAATAS